MRTLVLASVLSFTAVPVCAAQSAAPVPLDQLPITDAAPVVVTGVQPGPGMWKVTRGEHVLWVLGTLSPLPKAMQWQSRQVEDVLAQAQEVVAPPTIQVSAGGGFFSQLTLLPSMIGLRDNPDDRTLKDVVPAQSYARWSVLRQRYMPRKMGVEDWRPMFAAMELYDHAIDASGLARSGVVWPVVEKVVKERGIKLTRPALKVTLAKPRAAIKEFKTASLDDIACFDSTLRRIENDLPRMAQRANAWAIGDVEALTLLPYEENEKTCMQTAMQLDLMRREGMGDADVKVDALWLDAAQAALERNPVSLAVVPMSKLLDAQGYLAGLQARGDIVEAP